MSLFIIVVIGYMAVGMSVLLWIASIKEPPKYILTYIIVIATWPIILLAVVLTKLFH